MGNELVEAFYRAIQKAMSFREHWDALSNSSKCAVVQMLLHDWLTGTSLVLAHTYGKSLLWHLELLHQKHERVAAVDYQQEVELQHSFDVDQFSDRIDRLFEWHTDVRTRREFIAPYFALVQSSGMGKTKLLYEYQKRVQKKAKVHCVIVHCRDDDDDPPDQFYPHVDVYLNSSDKESTKEARKALTKQLDQIRAEARRSAAQRLVLLVDEAQLLLILEKAYLLRVFRWWLRRSDHYMRVAAVLAGRLLS